MIAIIEIETIEWAMEADIKPSSPLIVMTKRNLLEMYTFAF